MEDVPMNFTAIDFETANRSPASPCSVGMVKGLEPIFFKTFALKFPGTQRVMVGAERCSVLTR
jgi:hypothetical protein